MPNIIRNGKIVTDNWSLVDSAGNTLSAFLTATLPAGDLLLPLAAWREGRLQLIAHAGITGAKLGVMLEGNDDPAAVASDLQHFALVAVRFPQFGDGRGYSLARLLRERYGYRGELRAVGDVLRDNLFYLAQCGFDAFDLGSAADPGTALASLSDFSESYQATVAQPQPLFRRRSGAKTAGASA
jgi:uncharacterized protein (DUF934 family)